MSNPTELPGINRRALLTGLAATAAAAGAAGTAALPRSEVRRWDLTTDVLIAGSGAAGVCAAIEARQAGAHVILIESLSQLGGSSGMSAGVIYAGGGTALQRALGVEDTVEDMYRFLSAAGGNHPSPDKVLLYCEQSAAHFDWLVKLGVPYSRKGTRVKGVPMGDESLYFSGNELAWPARELATPAPRGHVPAIPGINGGRRLMEILLTQLRAEGTRPKLGFAGERLIVESDGLVTGMLVTVEGQHKTILARRGIVLACGGFIHNRGMVSDYAPQLYQCSAPWGNAGDQGLGINMGISAGAAAVRMHQGFAIAPLYPPENVLSGIVVNSSGQRFIAEDSYHGVLGDAIAYHQQGRAWLITDQGSSFPLPQDSFVAVAESNTIGDLASQLDFPAGALQGAVAYYNRHAAKGLDPMFHKNREYLRPLQGPPYRAWDLSVSNAFFPAHTLGGLQTTSDGEVLNSFGEAIPRLYAAGRTAAGLPGAPYLASGLSLGDCTFFGRRAGLAAASQRTRW